MFEYLPSRRVLNALGALACAGMMGFALYAQHGLGLEPCPLCVFQRVAVIALGVIFALAAMHNPGPLGRPIYAGLLLLAGCAGMGVAGRHVWLQNLPPDKVPACGPGLDFMLESFPMLEMLELVLSGSGECADIAWSLAGLTMPMWVFICCAGLTALGMLANLAAPR
ncbi:MAG: disulfide bond formation protein B [Gammaproteobacteria bacterium]|jgi:disulfide bond formation protein DsbB|nr:disulfide bond formation protein B [Gammaproteobacteria bacterium]